MNKEYNKYLQKRDAGVIQETDNSHKGDFRQMQKKAENVV